MNLFAVGWGLPTDVGVRVVEELRRTSLLYPHLDQSTLWHRQMDGGVVVAGVQSPVAVASPRVYRHTDPEGLTLFDGLPIDPSGQIVGHDASQLAAHWTGLSDQLEGRYCTIRVRENPPTVELINDPIGVYQVYCSDLPAGSLVSNSAGLIERVLGVSRADPLGVSLFLVLDWVGGDRTLRDGIRVAPGSQHWSWRLGDKEWTKRRYWSPPTKGEPVRIVDEALVAEVVDPLTRICAQVARVNGTLNAPLTGGKDSRMLAAVIMRAGIPASYWTKGDDQSLDLTIGREVARRYGLPHRTANRPTQIDVDRDPTRDVATEWETISRRFVIQNDGLASLYNVANIQGEPDRVERIAVTLSAMCAESARAGLYGRSHALDRGASAGQVVAYLSYRACGHPRQLVRLEAYRLARAHVTATLNNALEDGFARDNLPAQLYLDERCRRWAPNNPRELAQTEDKVLPFLSRPYVTAALSIREDERLLERLHRAVISSLVPGLESDPPLDRGWRDHLDRPSGSRVVRNRIMPLVPVAALRALVAVSDAVVQRQVSRTVLSPYDEESWLETNLTFVRDVCLSNDRSDVWDYLDRPTFARLLDDRTPAIQRRLFQYPLFAAMTMLQYEYLGRTELASIPRA